MDISKKKLYRSRTDRMIAGVCGGLATYLNIDPVLVRGAFIILGLIKGLGILFYLILIVIVPNDPQESAATNQAALFSEYAKEKISPRKDIFALFIIAFGLLLLIGQVFPWHWFRWDLFWPLVLVALGLWLILKDRN